MHDPEVQVPIVPDISKREHNTELCLADQRLDRGRGHTPDVSRSSAGGRRGRGGERGQERGCRGGPLLGHPRRPRGEPRQRRRRRFGEGRAGEGRDLDALVAAAGTIE